MSIPEIKEHRFFVQDWQSQDKTPELYWSKVKAKQVSDPPYKPNPLKYRYILHNKYPEKSNLIGAIEDAQEPSSAKVVDSS